MLICFLKIVQLIVCSRFLKFCIAYMNKVFGWESFLSIILTFKIDNLVWEAARTKVHNRVEYSIHHHIYIYIDGI